MARHCAIHGHEDMVKVMIMELSNERVMSQWSMIATNTTRKARTNKAKLFDAKIFRTP